MGENLGLAYLQLAKQSAKGTPNLTYTEYFKIRSGRIAPRPEYGEEDIADGSVWGGSIRWLESAKVGGSPELLAQPAGLAALIYWILGGVATSGVSDPYTHTITPADAGKYVTAHQRIGSLREQFNDLLIQQLVIDCSFANKLMKVTPTFIGLDLPIFKTGEPAAPVTGESVYYKWFDAKGSWVLDGGATTRINRLLITLTRQMVEAYGDNEVAVDVGEGKARVQTDFNLVAADFAKYCEMMYGSATPADGTDLSTDMPSGSLVCKFTQAAGPPERSLNISVPTLDYVPDNLADAANVNTAGAALEFAFKGFGTAATPITFTAKNARASY